MSIRFELKEGFRYNEVGKWMVERFGHPCDEGEHKTWFWSHGECYTAPSPHYPGLMETREKPEGIRIWKDGPAVTEAILKWGR